MNKRNDIDRKVNETLESLNGIQKAEPAPWFFSRVKARLEREQKNIWEAAGSFVARPSIAVAGLVLILAINALAVFEKDKAKDQLSTVIQNSNSAEEYVLTDVFTNYDYENLEP